MSIADQITERDVQVAFTFASIGYLAEGEPIECQQEAMRTALQAPDLPTEGKWQIVWGPWKCDTNLWYVALGPNAAGTPTAAIVIRGTQMKKPESLILDFDPIPVPVPWVDTPVPKGAFIARGFADAYMGLMQATTPSGQTLFEFIRTLDPAIHLDVIGHSLAGARAPLIALRVRSLFPLRVVRPFPLAGQFTGNAAFAQWFTDAFPKQPSRWINRFDVIPMAFWGLKLIKEQYAAPGPSCPWYIKIAVDVMLELAGGAYSVTGNPVRYEGRLYSETGSFTWEREISQQHQHLYYMYLAGVPESVIKRNFDSQWAPPPPPRR